MSGSRQLVFTILFLVCLGSIGSTIARADGGGEEGGVRDDKVWAGAYFQIPGTGEWAPIEIGVSGDPMEYTFRLKCFDESAGNLDCLYQNRNACTAGVGGRLVYWFQKLKGTDESAWMPMDPPLSCIYSEKPRDVGDQIRETILEEFQSQSIGPGQLQLQPSPHTLIGAHTNFYVESGTQVFDFVLFEQDIRIVARPTEYEWNYGDGTTYGPVHFSGAPLPESRWGEETPTSHIYRATGDFQASVVVYFSGEYSINGGPMVPIDGRATVPSAPQTVSVWKSESRNVADDCLVNPAGFGC